MPLTSRLPRGLIQVNGAPGVEQWCARRVMLYWLVIFRVLIHTVVLVVPVTLQVNREECIK